MKIYSVNNSQNIYKMSCNSNPFNSVALKPFECDKFVKSQSFGKREDKFATSEFLKTKIKNFYSKKQWDSFFVSTYINDLSTPQERKLVSDYIDDKKYDYSRTSDSIKDVMQEMATFHKLNGRAMNQKELNLFKEFIPGIEYRSSNFLGYNGKNVCELIPYIIENPDKKEDAKNLFASCFSLGEAYFSLVARDEEPEIPEQSIIRLLKYKEANPKIAQYIVPFATKGDGRCQTFTDAKVFFEYAKREKLPELLLKLGEIPAAKPKDIIKLYLITKDFPEFVDIMGENLKSKNIKFTQYLASSLKTYKKLAKTVKDDLALPKMFLKFKGGAISEYFHKRQINKIKTLTGNNPKIDALEGILYKSFHIDWEKLIPKDCTKEKANAIINRAYEAYSFVQRLDSEDHGFCFEWAVGCKIISDFSAKKIRDNVDFKTILFDIAKGYKGLPGKSNGGELRSKTEITTMYSRRDYAEYYDKFEKLFSLNRQSPFVEMKLTQLGFGSNECGVGRMMLHPESKYINKALEYAAKEYEKFLPYVSKVKQGETLSNREMKKAKSNIATIHYIITNSLPFMRGTAGIANILTRSLYKSIGITLSPTKHNVALDLEAFCNTLSDYKKNWDDFFEKC